MIILLILTTFFLDYVSWYCGRRKLVLVTLETWMVNIGHITVLYSSKVHTTQLKAKFKDIFKLLLKRSVNFLNSGKIGPIYIGEVSAG